MQWVGNHTITLRSRYCIRSTRLSELLSGTRDVLQLLVRREIKRTQDTDNVNLPPLSGRSRQRWRRPSA